MPAALGLLAGLILGSFIAALTARWPQRQSIATGRSRCPHCSTTLAARDLVPIVSYIALKGRCRRCAAPIAMRYPLIEALAGGIGAVALWMHPDAAGLASAAFGWGLLALLVLDLEHFWLPDALTLPLLAAGLALGAVLPPALTDRGIGAAAGFATLWGIAALYQRATGRTGLGGGDPKLFAAIGAWLGWALLPFVLLLAATLGLALVGYDRLMGVPVTRHSRVPLGALLAAAAWPLSLLNLSVAALPAIG
ncbi:MAG: prepilin peptidase [Alphaproteobacteria bacterium PA4]|nr:MAG: prepilin peptidase [Alphaproteobacteria bacterium PA4]